MEEFVSLWVGRLVLLAGGFALAVWLWSIVSDYVFERVKMNAAFWRLLCRWVHLKQRIKERKARKK